MTLAADRQRNRRQHFALPGGSHDRLVRTLAVALPAAVGMVFAFMLLAPFSPRSEISFLLDRNKVAMIDNRLSVTAARYRGTDGKGRPFQLSAGSALQRSARVPLVMLKDLTARIMLADGPATIEAGSADYWIDQDRVAVNGPVAFEDGQGYRLTANDLDVDLKGQTLQSRGRISGNGPAGRFSADRLMANMEARTVTLDGHARLTMLPGRLQLH